MKGKASDLCPKCKHCLGMTPKGMYSCGYANDGSELNIGIEVVFNCANFEPKPPCETCERFDGTYCHSPNGIFVTSYMALFGEYAKDNCPLYEKKKEKEPCDKISLLQHELEMDKLRTKIHQLEKEKAAHLKGIERLKKSQEKLQNQVKNLQTTNEESYKREEKLEDKCHKLESRLLDEAKRFDRLNSEFLMPLAHVLYPDEQVCKEYSEVLKDIKELRLEKTMKMRNYENELISLNTINKGLAEDRKKLINYIRSLKIASENYLKEFTYEED